MWPCWWHFCLENYIKSEENPDAVRLNKEHNSSRRLPTQQLPILCKYSFLSVFTLFTSTICMSSISEHHIIFYILDFVALTILFCSYFLNILAFIYYHAPNLRIWSLWQS